MKSIYLLILGIFFLSFVSSQNFSGCEGFPTVNTVNEFINEIQTINEKLPNCEINIPNSADFLLGSKDVAFSIDLDNGSTESFYLILEDKKIKSINKGISKNSGYKISFPESKFKEITNSNSSNDVLDLTLKAIDSKEIEIKPQGLWNKIKWFFVKFFLPKSN